MTASSTGTADGARTGLVKVILVSGDSEDMALYLGSRGARQKGSASSEFSCGQRGLVRGAFLQSSFASIPRLVAGRAINCSYQRLTLGKSARSTLWRGGRQTQPRIGQTGD